MDALRGTILSALQGRRPIEVSFLVLGAGLFGKEQLIEDFVLRSLKSQRIDYRIAATFASSFYLDKNQDLAVGLTERVVVSEGEPLILQASQEVLALWNNSQRGGRCQRCGASRTVLLTQKLPGLVPQRAS